MVQKCLITRFPSAVSDDSLPKYGEVELTIYKAIPDDAAILTCGNIEQDVVMRAENCLISTDKVNYSQEITLPKSPNWWTSRTIYGKNIISGVSKLSFDGKYANIIGSPTLKAYKGEEFIGALRYSKEQRIVNYSNVAFADGIDYALGLSDLRGGKYASLQLYNNSNAYGSLSDLQVSTLTDIDFRGCTGLTIPIASLQEQTGLKTLMIASDSNGVPTIDWTLEQLVGFNLLYRVELYGIQSSWSSSSIKASTTKAWGGIFQFSSSADVDNFLINMANCAVGDYKYITITGGSRTSASDSAVSSLKASGYTIRINGQNQ